MENEVRNLRYARVVSSSFTGAGFDYLDYKIPKNIELAEGDGVIVPFRHRTVFGYVIKISNKTNIEESKIFEIFNKVPETSSLTKEIIELAHWVSHNYFCPLSKTITSIIPSIIQSKVKFEYKINEYNEDMLSLSEREIIQSVKDNSFALKTENESSQKRVLRSLEKKGILKKRWFLYKEVKSKFIKCIKSKANMLDNIKLTAKQKEVFDFINTQSSSIPCSFLVNNNLSSYQILKSLTEKNLCEYEEIQVERIPDFTKINSGNITLTSDQVRVIKKVSNVMETGIPEIFLLHGVTASGKTEVYMNLIKKAIEMNKTALVLLPEIALTTQIMNIFKTRFGDLVAVLHSKLSEGEKFDEWQKIRDCRAKIVLGARSAVFAPLENIGIIIIDEEHDSGYKQDNQPKYHTRDVAKYRGIYNNAVLVLGSATPSVESYFHAENGDYKLLEMPERVGSKELPKVFISDLSCQKDSQPSIFSKILYDKIEDRLNKKEQIILMQNRRAFSTFILCRDCGYVAKCTHCDVSLKYHKATRKLTCHHCDYTIDAPRKCPECESIKIDTFGIGTQKVEEFVKLSFPNTKVLRMDKDTTNKKGTHQSILTEFSEGNADILIGTQMIAKGLDFPNVTLVGIISADMDLNLPDFRAGERTFQLISQVAGRSGRGSQKGEVVIQTFSPDNYSIQNAANHNYKKFYDIEIDERKELFYPPYSNLIKISTQNKDFSEAQSNLENFHNSLKKLVIENDINVKIYPVKPALIPKIKDVYRFNMLIKTSDREHTSSLIRKILSKNDFLRKIISIDIEPTFLD